VVREASKRVLGLRPFDVQLIGKSLAMNSCFWNWTVILLKITYLQLSAFGVVLQSEVSVKITDAIKFV